MSESKFNADKQNEWVPMTGIIVMMLFMVRWTEVVFLYERAALRGVYS